MIPDIYPQARPQAILFDWDNTLVDSWRTILDCINIAKASMDIPPMTEKEFWAIPHHSVKNAAQELFGKNWQEAEEIYYKNVREKHLEGLSLLDGAAELLDHLTHQSDIYVAVVSNKHGELLRRESTHLGWDHHYGSIIGSRDTAEDKPSPIPVHEALKPAGLKAGHHVWFIGDSVVDVECARNSGCVPVVVGNAEASNQNDIVHAKTCQGIKDLLGKL